MGEFCVMFCCVSVLFCVVLLCGCVLCCVLLCECVLCYVLL